jgi:hypothetical protein
LFFTAKQTPADLDVLRNHLGREQHHTDAVNGIGLIALTYTLTSVAPSTYHHNIQWVGASCNDKTILQGKLTVRQDIATGTA